MNTSAIHFYENLGVDRVVFAREVDYQDLKEVREKVDIDLEYFIHGAMCIHYSGRCMLSNYFQEEMPIVEDVRNHAVGIMIFLKRINN